VFFPGIFVCSQSGHHPLESRVFFFLGVPILWFQGEFLKLLIRNIFDSTLEKRKFPKTFNRHSAKIQKKNRQIWKMQKKWQSSKGIFSQIWL
jgi:hypothetical protein